ncbi:MAG: TonB-dependent receptor [Saprospiraceae bacterium]
MKINLSSTLLFMLIGMTASAQKGSIQGTVTGDGLPIEFASVGITALGLGASTDANGKYVIDDVPYGTYQLTGSFVGYTTFNQTVTVNSSDPVIMDVSLGEGASLLDEIIVTGYTSQKKKDITGAVSVVNVKSLKAIPSGTIESVLQGNAAGVTIINSGAPGSPSNIRVRGITSVGSTDPLMIIDGTPGSIHDLNPNDIQSIQILKDAGAAAIYGVRGSNGVIIVTTKRGTPGKVTVNYEAYIGSQRPLKNGWDLATPQENADAIWTQFKNSGLAPLHAQYGSGANAVVPDYITPFGLVGTNANTDPSKYALYTNQITKANKEGTDWFHEIFKPATIMNHDLSISGGSEKGTFMMSLNYLDQDGTLIRTNLKRYSARINSNFNVNKNIRIGESIYMNYKKNPGYLGLPGVNNANSINAAFRMPRIVPVYDIMGNFAGGGSRSLGNSPNPVAIMERTKDNKENRYGILGNVFGEIDFLKHFTARTSIGGTTDIFNNYTFVFTAYENAENSQNPNSFIENYGTTTSLTWNNTLNYKNTFNAHHNLNVLLGTESISNAGRGVSGARGSYYVTNPADLTVDPNLWTLNFGTPTGQSNSNIAINGFQTPYENSLFSTFGRVDYNFDNKYYLSGTLRRDGSSVFAPENRFGIFPSVTAGWRISAEPFMKGVSFIDDLKLRAGWGKLGSLSNVTPTNAFTLYGQSSVESYYDINGTSTTPQQGLFASQIGNTQTTWEEDIITNIGFDASLAKGKLDLTAEWYKKEISGLLFPAAIPATAGGARPPLVNSGNIQNTGIDLSVTYHGKVNSDFSFDIGTNITTYANEVKSLPPGFQYIDYGQSRLQVGQAIGAFFGYKQIGLFQSQAEVDAAPKQDAAAPGRSRYADINGDNKIDANDRTHFGNPNPDFTAGLSLSATYKNLDFGMFWYANVGNDLINNVRNSIDFPQTFDVAISKAAVYDSWTPDRPNAKVPKLERGANFSNNTAFNSYLMEDGSFVRLKNLQVGYTFPLSKLAKIGASKFRIYVQAVNLLTFTKYTGLDPEILGSTLTSTNFGIDGGAYPANQTMYTGGINITF